MGSTEDLEKSTNFLFANSKKPRKDIDKVELKTCVTIIEKNAEAGFSSKLLEELAYHVVFNDNYDITTRRKILYCMVPKDWEFPYHIIPLAISHATAVPVNPSWQYTVLSWLGGLLEYCVIDAQNKYVRICYTAIFNLTSSLNLVLLASKILGYMTTRVDVTTHRTRVLLQLKGKAGFYENASQLLRLYQLYRPDLVVGTLSPRHRVQHAPRNLKLALLALRARLQESSESEFLSSRSTIWPERSKAQKVNVYLRPSAIPQPDNNYYAETMEEKTSEIVFVTQFRRFSELVKAVPDFKKWKWPNNPVTHLSRPEIIPLFRPHQLDVLLGITNWLDVALRAELIDGFGQPSQERREKLLKSLSNLVTATDSHIPVVNRFLAEYVTVWNQNSHFEIMLELFSCITYSTPDFIAVTYLKLVGELLYQAPLVKWCRVVEAVSNTAATWAVRSHNEFRRTEEYLNWPLKAEEEFDSALVGLWFLTYQMERHFIVALIQYNYHPMVVHQVLDYYIKVNMWTEKLNLPAMFAPPVLFIVAVTTKSDLVTVHRLAKLLASLSGAVDRVKSQDVIGYFKDVQAECLSMCESINQSVLLFMSAVYLATALGKNFRKALDQFYPFKFLEKTLGSKHARSYAAVTHSLPYLPFSAEILIDKGNAVYSPENREEFRKQVIAKLSDAGLTGIQECLTTYKKM